MVNRPCGTYYYDLEKSHLFYDHIPLVQMSLEGGRPHLVFGRVYHPIPIECGPKCGFVYVAGRARCRRNSHFSTFEQTMD